MPYLVTAGILTMSTLIAAVIRTHVSGGGGRNSILKCRVSGACGQYGTFIGRIGCDSKAKRKSREIQVGLDEYFYCRP